MCLEILNCSFGDAIKKRQKKVSKNMEQNISRYVCLLLVNN